MKLSELYNQSLLTTSNIGQTVQEHSPNLDALATTTGSGTLRKTATGYEAAESLFIQPAQPDFGDEQGLWVQTGLPNDGVSLWVQADDPVDDDGGTDPEEPTYDYGPDAKFVWTYKDGLKSRVVS